MEMGILPIHGRISLYKYIYIYSQRHEGSPLVPSAASQHHRIDMANRPVPCWAGRDSKTSGYWDWTVVGELVGLGP
jgi:hypothetical protein